jgi:hypothetical protein
MSTYTLMVFIHIAAAVLLLGTSIVGEPVVRAAARRTQLTRELRAFLEVARPMALLSPIAALLVLGSGIYLTSVIRIWSLGWIQVSVVFWLVNGLVAVAVVKPAMERLVAEAASATDEAIGPRLDELRWSPAWSWGRDTMAANDAAVLFLMTLRPGLAVSLAVVLLVNAVVAGGRIGLRLYRPRVARAYPVA